MLVYDISTDRQVDEFNHTTFGTVIRSLDLKEYKENNILILTGGAVPDSPWHYKASRLPQH